MGRKRIEYDKIIPMKQDYDVIEEAKRNTFGKKMGEARRAKHMSIRGLTKELEAYNIYLQSPAVNKWELGQTTPNPYQFFALCRLLDIEDGVRFFSGPLHPGEKSLNEEGLKKVEEYREDLEASGLYANDDYEDADEKIEKKVFDLSTSAGTGTFLDSDDYHMESFEKSTVPDKADFALIINGDSMMPNYTDGQMVWVQETPELRSGEIGIFVLNGSGFMKKYTEINPGENELEDYTDSEGFVHPKVMLRSLNKKYDPINIGIEDELHIVGRVLTK